LLIYLIYLLQEKAPFETIAPAGYFLKDNENYVEETIALMRFV
jgi:hypothetical protein